MVYLIIAIILLVIVAPIIRVLPSKEQREQMIKRRLAMGKGISVELVRIEDPDPDPKKHRSTTGKALPRELSVAAYRIHRGRSALEAEKLSWKLLRFAAEKRPQLTSQWYWADAQSALKDGALYDHLSAQVDHLPADVKQIEEKNQFISLYWHERGEVTEVIDFLKRTVEV